MKSFLLRKSITLALLLLLSGPSFTADKKWRKSSGSDFQMHFDSDIAAYQVKKMLESKDMLSVAESQLEINSSSFQPLELDRRITKLTELVLTSSHHLDDPIIVRANQKLFGANHSVYESLISVREEDTAPPSLNAIAVDKTTIDVSESSQIITFTVDATDATGIDWGAGQNQTGIVYQDASGGYHHATGDDVEPGKLSIEVTAGDKGGVWTLRFLALTDTSGNKSLFGDSALQSLGLPSFLYLLSEGEVFSDIRLSATTRSTVLVEESESKFVLKVENLGDLETGTLDFTLSSINVSVDSIARANGELACATSTLNYNSSVICSISSISAGSSINLTLDVTAGTLGNASFSASINGSIPDINYLDNNYYALLTVESDLDNDGIVNSIDTDDDGDGLTDGQEASYGTNPLLKDSDNDGYSDAEEVVEGTDPLDGNSAPRGGLNIMLIKAAMDKKKAAQ